jgi:exodeoxyribonuclease VII small subunit
MSETQELSFEEALLKLEQTVDRLEAGNLSLDEALSLFEAGQKLAEQCNGVLEQAVLRVARLTAAGETEPIDIQ